MDQSKLFLSSFGGDPGPSPDPGDPIAASARFVGNNHLSRTFGAPTDGALFSLSGWFKPAYDNTALSQGGPAVHLLATGPGGANQDAYGVYTTSLTCFCQDPSSGYSNGGFNAGGSRAFRDTGAWYHYYVAVSSVEADASKRVKVYINGVRQQTSLATYPLAQNSNIPTNSGNREHYIGMFNDNIPSSGYMAQLYFIDGQALPVETFGRFNDNGVWVPVTPSGLTFGNNGYLVDFSDPNNPGKDMSPNGNDWTPTGWDTDPTSNGYSFTADSPTQNWATLNPLYPNPSSTLINANLKVYDTNTTYAPPNPATIKLDGKYYWEVLPQVGGGSYPYIGVGILDPTLGSNEVYQQALYVAPDGGGGNFGLPISNNTFTDGDVVGLAYDSNSRELTVTYNGTGSQTFTAGGTDDLVPMAASAVSGQATFNFGQQPFIYTPPDGFSALQTQNLPAATIVDGRDHFRAITGPGDGANATPSPGQIAGNWSQYLTVSGYYQNDTTLYAKTNAFNGITDGAGFTSEADGNWTFAPATPIPVTSSVTVYQANTAGTTSWNGQDLTPNATFITFNGSGEISQASPITSTTAGSGGQSCFLYAIVVDGEILVDYGILPAAQQTFPDGLWWIKDRVNTNNHQLIDSVRGSNALKSNSNDKEVPYVAPAGDSVAWCWKAGGAAETNNDGALASQVSANTKAGFSILTWTGSAANSSVGHGLGQTPDMVIYKSTTEDPTDWVIQHVGMDPDQYMHFNAPNGAANDARYSNGWHTDSVLNIGSISAVNGSGHTMLAYCWHSVTGYSAFGSYEGNGDADGPFIYTGFRPAFVLVKNTVNPTTHWRIWDSTRNIVNPANLPLFPSAIFNEADNGEDVDFLSNGFKIRTNNGADNESGSQIVYAAFAENPFQSPVTAR